MTTGMQAVAQGTPVSTAASAFNVPQKTLDDCVKGRVKHETKPGPDTGLTVEEDAAFVSYLMYMAEQGFTLTQTVTMAFAWAISKRSGTANRFNPETWPG